MASGKGESATQRYAECLAKLYQTHSLKLGLERTKQLSECFDNPGDTYQTVHVAGTNGKGSVSYKISMCLKVRSYTVGLFTSPHVLSIRERIKVNDECISEEDFVHLVEEIWRKSEQLDVKPTFFEIVTLVAYLFFKSKKVDYAVVETGIGGRLDATNILKKPELVVITSIGYDHQELLGTQLNSICDEKMGIIKEGTHVVIGPSVSIYKNIFKRAKDLNCVLKVVPPEPRGESFDEENTRIATEALKMLKVDVSLDPILKSVICVKPPLRMQYLAIEQIQHVKKKIFASSGAGEKVASWLEGAGKGGSPGGNLYTRGTIPLIVKNAFLESCKDNSILLFCGTFFMFDEVLPVFDIHSGRTRREQTRPGKPNARDRASGRDRSRAAHYSPVNF
ncbi:dihydrofolate synthase/folylpolyglutamate synthase [Plasmodium cynomolgi strain B]|uniref:Dihydrofolate synthase/folylpolyglutamate synthase n=1 Tax=Plasmodium cynomolgi (strain B) TaxID=1120755 RepID=K6UW22_PLACD|nr:dihydrofolate synthase/folylpolyglutamate synthase [Plasmodium cynomolgi strain B]GAB67814.1 dihydrofolate synthase/folylpolyglutamate synthase [Plasmodium cynomolgi strain B]